MRTLTKPKLKDMESCFFRSQRYSELAYSLLLAIHRARQPIHHVPSCCECGKCQERVTKNKEKVLCCKEYPCLTTTYIYQQWREIHLDYCVMTTALESKHKTAIDYRNKTATDYRRYAYSQFITWKLKYGHLGKGVREQIPSCVVWNICCCYPALDGKYEGFKK